MRAETLARIDASARKQILLRPISTAFLPGSELAGAPQAKPTNNHGEGYITKTHVSACAIEAGHNTPHEGQSNDYDSQDNKHDSGKFSHKS